MQDKYYTALVEELGKRFPDLPIIKAFQVCDLQLLPSSDSEKLLHIEMRLFLNYFITITLIRVLFNNNGRAFRSLMKTQEYTNKSTKDILKLLSVSDTHCPIPNTVKIFPNSYYFTR